MSTVIFDPIQETHTLSGLGQWVMPWDDDTQETSNNEFVVPMDRDLAICGWPTVDDIESIVRVPKAISLEFRQDRTSGCPVHMRCWNYVERVLGPEAEENLGLLYRVFRDRYQECEYERLTNANMIAFTKGIRQWIHLLTKPRANNYGMGGRSFRKQRGSETNSEKSFSVT